MTPERRVHTHYARYHASRKRHLYLYTSATYVIALSAENLLSIDILCKQVTFGFSDFLIQISPLRDSAICISFDIQLII